MFRRCGVLAKRICSRRGKFAAQHSRRVFSNHPSSRAGFSEILDVVNGFTIPRVPIQQNMIVAPTLTLRRPSGDPAMVWPGAIQGGSLSSCWPSTACDHGLQLACRQRALTTDWQLRPPYQCACGDSARNYGTSMLTKLRLIARGICTIME